MSVDDGVEQVLRETLRAEVSGAPAPGPWADRATAAGRRRRRALVGAVGTSAVAVVIAAGAAIAWLPDRTSSSVTAGGSPDKTAPATPERTGPASTATYGAPTGPAPEVSNPDVGVAYPYHLYTHCGVEFAAFGGRSWRTSHPLSRDNGGAPIGWDNPLQAGTVTLLDADTLRFTAPGLPDVDFAPTTAQQPPCA